LNYLNESYDLNNPSLVSILDELPLWSAPFGLKLLDSVIFKPDMNVLDIGCGAGFPLIELANRLGSSCHIFGIDPWTSALKRIQLKTQIQNLSNVTLINGKAEHLPFVDEFFSMIVSNNGINNVENPEAVLAECYRTSRSKAQMIITINLSATMKQFYSIFEETLREQGKLTEISKMQEHIHEKRKPYYQTISMITNAGFCIKRIYEEFFTMRFLDGSAMFNHFFIKLAFLDNWKKILAPEDRKPIFEILEQKLNNISTLNGALSLNIPYVCIDCSKD
jgi:arsenite methyltransferase